MIKFVTIFVAALVYLTDASYVRDYYWKDFDGLIPNDAFSVGENQYVGQGLTSDGRILIGALDNSTSYFNAFDPLTEKSLKITNSVKILCTESPESFVWASNGLKNKGNLVRVYAGVTKVDDVYPFGNLVIAKTTNQGYVGFLNALADEYFMYYVVNDTAKLETKYDELYYNVQ